MTTAQLARLGFVIEWAYHPMKMKVMMMIVVMIWMIRRSQMDLYDFNWQNTPFFNVCRSHRVAYHPSGHFKVYVRLKPQTPELKALYGLNLFKFLFQTDYHCCNREKQHIETQSFINYRKKKSYIAKIKNNYFKFKSIKSIVMLSTCDTFGNNYQRNIQQNLD